VNSTLIAVGCVGLANVAACFAPVLKVRTALRSLERLRVQPGSTDAAADISRVLDSLHGTSRHGTEEKEGHPPGGPPR
jgi:hypothetical protein